MLHINKNFTLLIFGASGALAKLKIFPAIYQLMLEGRIPHEFLIVGYARSELSNEDFHAEFEASIKAFNKDYDRSVVQKMLKNIYYVSGEYGDVEGYEKLLEKVEELEGKKDRVRVAYFAVPPFVFDSVIDGVSQTFRKSKVPLRLVLEKPFGNDLKSAKELKAKLDKDFDMDQIFLLDHYLGKESVFNLLSLRYANSIFSYLVQGKCISNIQITAFENIGLEGRAGYFDNVGTLKDMVQSHLFQILVFLGMYIPRKFSSELVHQSKVHLLENLFCDPDPENVVRGQFAGYTSEEGVAVHSQTETFVALKMGIDSANWHGVPIYLRTGKCLTSKWTSVVIEFKPHEYQKKLGDVETNKLVIELDPSEKIEFYLLTKRGGEDMIFDRLTTGKPIYCSGDCLMPHARLLVEVIHGDRMLFLDFPEVYEAWKIVDPISEMFAQNKVPLEIYDCKSAGPASADKLLEKDGFEWFKNF